MNPNQSICLRRASLFLMLLSAACRHGAAAESSAAATGKVKPPPGFIALFNGADLGGWRGGDTFDHRKLLAMPAAERAAQIAQWTETMKAHWSVEHGEMVKNGHGAYASTGKD